jgi:Kef-type K+ transport system membrane component KefB
VEIRAESSEVVRTILIYVSVVVAPAMLGVALCLAIAGDGSPGESTAEAVPAGEIPSPLQLLLAIAVVSMAAAAGGLVARWLHQPQVVGQMIAGLAIGPSLLGRLAPGVESWLFSPGTAQILALFGGVGAIFFIFLVGLDFPLAELRRSGASTVVLGQGTMAIPFLMGSLLAVALTSLGEGAPASSGIVFNLFIALAMSVTALPVLAHILRERGLDQTSTGATGIASSAVCDTTAWCFLAVVLAMAHSTSPSGAFIATLLVVLFALIMWFGLRPALVRAGGQAGRQSRRSSSVACFLRRWQPSRSVPMPSLVLFWPVFVYPRSAGYRTINSRIEGLVEWFLLPMFFASVGLQTKISLLNSVRDILIFLLILAVAVISKAVATVLVARALGITMTTGPALDLVGRRGPLLATSANRGSENSG